MAEDDSAKRSNEKQDGKSDVGEQEPARSWGRKFDEHERGDCPIQELVVLLDGAADEANDRSFGALRFARVCHDLHYSFRSMALVRRMCHG